MPGPGVQAVLDQFLDDRRRPLDDLAGCDLADELGWQVADGHGRIVPPAAAMRNGESNNK
jgi:hypothetical protein